MSGEKKNRIKLIVEEEIKHKHLKFIKGFLRYPPEADRVDQFPQCFIVGG